MSQTNDDRVVTIVLDGTIYKAAAVRAAIRDYRTAASVDMETGDESTVLKITGFADEYADVIGHEFTNYILWKMRNRK